MLTLARARTELCRSVAGGVSSTDPRVDKRINEATERLFTATDFKGKRERYVVCARQAVVSIPRHLETVVGADIANQPYHIRNDWFEFIENGPGALDPNSYTIQGIVDRGDGWPLAHDLCSAKRIKVYADLPEDADAKVLIQGLDGNGNRVMTLVDGEYVDGEYVALNNATPQVSTKSFAKITGVQKERTNGPVRIYQYTPAVAEIPEVPESTTISYEGSGATLSNIDDSFTAESVQVDLTVDADPDTGFATGNAIVPDTADPLASGGLVSPAGGPIDFSNGGPVLFTISDYGLFNQSIVFTRVETVDPGSPGVPGVPASQSLLGILHPDDEVPSLRRYLIPGITPDDAQPTQVLLLCQRRWMQVSRSTDLVVPGNIGALKNMILALEFEEKEQPQLAAAYEAKAVRILKDELKQFLGPGATPSLNIQIRGFTGSWGQMW